jgi:predicted PurR-regulated permease PerM
MAKRPTEAGDRGFVRRVLIVIGLVGLALLAWHLRALLLMLFGAVVVASIFRALADRLQGWTGMREGIAVALSIVGILGAAGLLIAIFGSAVVGQVEVLREALPAAWRSFEGRIGDMGLGEQLRHLMESVRSQTGSSALGRFLLSLGSGLADVLVVLVAGIFLAAQPRFYAGGAIKLVPQAKRKLVGEAMAESENALRLWLKGQLIAMVAVGLLVGLGLWALGMPSALALGLLAGMLEFIPFAGPIIAALPALLLSLAVGPDMALWVVLLYLAVQQFEGYVLTPLVQQYAVDLPGVVLIFSLIGFGTLFGTLGLILAAPLTVVSYVLVKRLYVIEALHTATPIPGGKKAP